MKKPSKIQQELTKKYEEKIQREWIEGMEKEPIVGLMEWVELMNLKRKNNQLDESL